MKIFLIFFLAAAGFFAMVRYLESVSIFFPYKEVSMYPKDIGLSYEDIYFTTEDDILLNGWFIRNPDARKTLLFFHGNAGNISHRLGKISLFYPLGFNIFIIDYRGYGKSKGRPSEQGIYADARAAYDYLLTRKDIDKNKILAYGASLGGVVAIDLAIHRSLAGLIVNSCFSSAADMAKRIFPFIPSFLIRTEMDSISKVSRIYIPKLFFHSPEDDIVPFDLGKKLFDAAAEPKKFVETKGDHNSGYEASSSIITNAINYFFN